MNVPFVDFQPQYCEIQAEIELGLKKVFEKGNFILGQEEKDFETEFASYCQSAYGVGVNSGTDALHLALRALDIGPGDEVIVPTFTFIATALAVSYTGAKPVFADIQEKTCNIDPEQIKKLISPRTKAIIVVHLYGQPADMDVICDIARKNNLRVVEDCAQAHGALYQGKKVGSLGDIGCFSFYPTKGLGAFGDGGFITTDSRDLYDKILLLRDYGRQGRYAHIAMGYNSRLDTLQAVILSAKLKRLDQWNQKRNQCAKLYKEILGNIQDIQVPDMASQRTHTFQTFAIRVNDRDRVCQKMQEQDIGVLIHYPLAIHLQQVYAPLKGQQGDCPVAETISQEVLSLPMFPHLSNQQIETVCQALQSAMGLV